MRPYQTEHFVGRARKLECAIVVPTLNEVGNIERLVTQLSVALSDLEAEIIFVDDGSTDGTIDLIEAIASSDPRVRLIRRIDRRGLSSAVVEGFLSTIAPVVAVMDGDMQHDEAVLPELISTVGSGDADLAVGTRYANGGSVGNWSAGRVKISRMATRMAGRVIRAPLSDPMSGFFAIKRTLFLEAAPRLSQAGYKILLDIVTSHPGKLTVREIPYEFRSRAAGESKLDSAVALEFFELLLEKSLGRILPAKLIIFGTIGLVGTVVHLALLSAFLMGFGLAFAAAQAVATVGAMTFNYTLNNILTYRDRKRTGIKWLTGWLSFCAACSIGAIANIGVGTMLFIGSQSWWISGLAGAIVGSVWNYVATSWFTWRNK